MMPNWTKEQQEAIDRSGENIIVSAGAGSGKTAVLSERVLKKVLNGMDIDRMLILTFTKAAASEMKERIRKKIKEKKELANQLKKIDSSYITTFDSFSLSLVKKYHYLLNVKKDINIIEENILNIKVQEYLDLIMEEEYHDSEKDFTKLINDFCVKDDFELKRMILRINDKLNLKYDKDEYLRNYLNSFYQEEYIKDKINLYLNFLKDKIKYIDRKLDSLSQEVEVTYYRKLEELFNPLLNSNTYQKIKENVSIERLPNMPKGSSDVAKTIKGEISDTVKEIKLLTRFSSEETLEKTILSTRDYVQAIIRIIEKLDQKVNEYKQENDLYDFVDISKMAIRIVKENKEIKEEIRDFFQEILVDEYQDTSDLQEEFIQEISNNNLYMVGDVKQSIYRFRNANPNIFRYKYNSYAKHDGGIKIDLVKNFRSREEVLANINLIFNYVMSDLIGGANYRLEHQMIFGNDSYIQEGKTAQNYNLEIYEYPLPNDKYFKKEEIEAFIIANDILDKIKNHYQVFDKDEKKLRDITFKDFSIIIDRSSSFELYQKIFLYKHIPLSVYKDEYLTNSSLFLVIKNIFRLIAFVYDHDMGKEMTYAFLSVGRSFLFDYSDQELFDIIIHKRYMETAIIQKINKIVLNLSSKSIRMILDEIIDEFQIYQNLRKINDLENNYVKIDYLYTLADNLNKMGYNLRDFDDYIEKIMDNKTDIKFSIDKGNDNSVKIMTIHKSKGLEYHLCYFPGLDKKFNNQDIKDNLLYDNKLGIITPYYDDGLDNTFYQDLMKENYYHDNISEEIRLFYVALTRAKEKMIMIVPESEGEERYEDDLVSKDIRFNYQSFLDILNSLKEKLKPFITKINLENLLLTKDYTCVSSNNLFSKIKESQEEITIIDYPKYHQEEEENSHFSKSNIKVFTKEEQEKLSFGEMMHYYLETIDLQKADLSDIPERYHEKIKAFLASDLLKNIKKAKVYQEYEFTVLKDHEISHGIMDLLLEYSDHFVVIDYKLKNIDDPAYLKQLQGYKDYLKTISNKPVYLYLYSIMDSQIKEINADFSSSKTK